jgi:hypothetical protein
MGEGVKKDEKINELGKTITKQISRWDWTFKKADTREEATSSPATVSQSMSKSQH